MAMNKELKHRGTEDTETSRFNLCALSDSVFPTRGHRNEDKSIGVSEYQITSNLPEQLRSSLPSIEQIEVELGGFDDECVD